MTNAQWSNVITKLTTALNAAANDNGDLGTFTDAFFKGAITNIDLEQTTEYSYYKCVVVETGVKVKILLNADYAIGATQADLSAKVATAINGMAGNGPAQQ
jgi:hypothetical protein